MKINEKTWAIRLQPPPWMNLNTIKKLIMSWYVVKNYSVAFFQNDLKTCQLNNIKASEIVLFESMHAKKLLRVTPNIRSNNYRDAQPTMNEEHILPKKSHSKNKWLIDSSLPQPHEHKTKLVGRTLIRLKFSFVGIISLIVLQSKRDTLSGTNLLQINSEQMLIGISPISVRIWYTPFTVYEIIFPNRLK